MATYSTIKLHEIDSPFLHFQFVAAAKYDSYINHTPESAVISIWSPDSNPAVR